MQGRGLTFACVIAHDEYWYLQCVSEIDNGRACERTTTTTTRISTKFWGRDDGPRTWEGGSMQQLCVLLFFFLLSHFNAHVPYW